MPHEMTNRERFLALMEYKPIDRIPNWEVGVWSQTIPRWINEGLDASDYTWDWFTGESALNLDYREYIPIHFGMNPWFEMKVLERTDKYEVLQHYNGVVTKALIEGSIGHGRMCMDQYLSFPVENSDDFKKLTAERYDPTQIEARYPADWKENIQQWKTRDHVMVLGRNCSTLGFYWRMREWMGTENLSFGLLTQPQLIHEMAAFVADFTIKLSDPILNALGKDGAPDYIFINEDMAMKTGPLLGPSHYREYIFPHMKRLSDYFKSKGVRYIVVDSDGNPEPLIPLLMEAGVDAIWPIERASNDMDPVALRKKYGKELRLWGCVDKRELAVGRKEIDAHLRSLIPMVEAGGFIPTVDHTVPPDVSLSNFLYYMEQKEKLLRGEL